MARRAFYSFHYKPDCSRAGQIRNMGVIEGNAPATDNDWETVKRGGDPAIQRWIDGQLVGKSVTIVLIGAKTAGRPWITYEIKKSWEEGKAVFGVHIHGLKDLEGKTASKGDNPFAYLSLGDQKLSEIVKVYDPWALDSKGIYAAIKDGLPAWIEAAVEIRKKYPGATV